MKIFEINPGLFIWSLITFLVLVVAALQVRLQAAHQDGEGPAGLDQRGHQRRGEAARRRRRPARRATSSSWPRPAKRRRPSWTGRARPARPPRPRLWRRLGREAEATLAKARQQIERDTNQALQKIREEVADLTIAATAKVARTGLSGEDQLRLIQEAINEIDLSKVSEN